MGLILTHQDVDKIGATSVIRSMNPADHRQFNEILPWFTPRFVFTLNGRQYVRWIVPAEKAEKYGLTQGCACCGEQSALQEGDGYLIDTLLSDVDWWLAENGYTIPTKEGESS